ncbi:hypothetical protein [Peribacillus kribbensis]|nr:hypothetical protein [Peribacillus kribbensis]
MHWFDDFKEDFNEGEIIFEDEDLPTDTYKETAAQRNEKLALF